MGAGASATRVKDTLFAELEIQKAKPLDGSDMADLESAKEELGKLRQLLLNIDSDQLQKLYLSERVEGAAVAKISGLDALVTDSDEVPAASEYGTALLAVIKDKMDQRFKSLHETFLSVDTDRSGYISKEEFQEACSKWGMVLNDVDFENVNSLYLHQESEKSLDGGINYNEFIALMTGEGHYKPGEGEPATLQFVEDVLREKLMDGGTTMRRAFQVADTDGSGCLEKDEIKAVFTRYHIQCDENEFEQFFSKHDKNGDGKFSYGEFVKLIQSGDLL